MLQLLLLKKILQFQIPYKLYFIQKDFNLTKQYSDGGDIYREPYRWDQRFFTLIINSNLNQKNNNDGNKIYDKENDYSNMESFCQVRTYESSYE